MLVTVIAAARMANRMLEALAGGARTGSGSGRNGRARVGRIVLRRGEPQGRNRLMALDGRSKRWTGGSKRSTGGSKRWTGGVIAVDGRGCLLDGWGHVLDHHPIGRIP